MKRFKTTSLKELTIRALLDDCGDRLDLTLLNTDADLDRHTDEPSINRPGLALANFFDYFPDNRIQVLGQTEISYIEANLSLENFEEICTRAIPGFILCRGLFLPQEYLDIAASYKIPVLKSSILTIKIINQVTLYLEKKFSERVAMHGCLVEIHGIGVLITGESGSGKSEAAIGLIEKGGSLVADDHVTASVHNDELIGRSKPGYMGFMEVRGVGIMNIANLYGSRAFIPECRIDLIVNLKPFEDLNNVDRLGMNRKTSAILGVEVPTLEIPVAPGRDTARLVDVAAMDFQLRSLGVDMAGQFKQNLHKNLQADSN